MEWISVKDRLPEKGETVLLTVIGHDCISQRPAESLLKTLERVNREVRYTTVGCLEEDGWYLWSGFPMVVHPAYWMPLPEPAKDGGAYDKL